MKVPGATATADGVAKDHPDRTAGSWNQTAGSAKEFVGGVLGNEVCVITGYVWSWPQGMILTFFFLQSLKQSGRQQNREGQEQEARGQLNDFTSGAADRVAGSLGSGVAAVTGDRVKQAQYQDQHDEGKTKQRGAEYDIRKQAEAGSQ